MATAIRPRKPVQSTEKQKPVAYVNWSIPGSKKDEVLLRSTRGFSLFDNEYLTLEEKALIDLAKQHGGDATIAVEMRVIIAKDKPDHLDISKVKVLK